MAKRFRRPGDTRRNSRVLKGHNVLFDCLLWTFLLMIVVGEILHLQGSFQGALGLDNCFRCRCTCPRFVFDRGTINTLEILSGKSQTFPFNFFGASSLWPFFPSIRRSKKVNCMLQCTEMYRKTISRVIWVGTGALDATLSQINKKIGNRFHFQWHRRRVNYQFSNCVTDKVNGWRVQPPLFGEDQGPDPGDSGNRAYRPAKAFFFTLNIQTFVLP